MKDDYPIFPPPKPEWLAEMEERDASMGRLLTFMAIFYAVSFSGILFVVSERDSTKAGCAVIIIICGLILWRTVRQVKRSKNRKKP